jgi:HAE1 family hydrophobic/amphiphilic exporter-1
MDTTTQKKSIWEFFLKHQRFTLMLLVAGALIGLISATQIPRESSPEIDIPIGVISIPFPGASAEDVEELVTDIVEGKVLNLDQVKQVTSTSREGVSVVVVEYEANADSEERVRDLKDKIDELKPELPSDTEDPIVQKVRFSDVSIYTFAMSGPYSEQELKLYADELKDRIERVSGVSKVTISGGREKEIQVIVNPAQLDTFGLSIQDVTSAISRANTDIPAGSIETAGAKYNIRLSGQVNTVEDVRRIPITALGDVPVFVEDVADVSEGEQEITTISRLSIAGREPLPALTIGVYKTTGGNIIRMTDDVDTEIDSFKSEFLPEDIVFETIQKDADYIKDDLSTLTSNGLGTVIIVTLVLYFFIGFRESLLAGLAIPLSFLLTFIFLAAAGSTLNFLTLFSLILALGILIDAAVVITQGIHARLETGMSPHQAATLTIRDFHLPLIAGTLTTVFAFLPMLLMSGIMGQFIKYIPITVTIVLISSLFVALAFIPTLGTMWLHDSKQYKRLDSGKEVPTTNNKNIRPQRNGTRSPLQLLRACLKDRELIFSTLTKKYTEALSRLMIDRSKRRKFFWALVISFVISLSLPITGLLKVQMFPDEDQDFMYVGIELPVGTPIETTDLVMQQAEQVLLKEAQIASFSTNVGQGAPTDDGAGSGTHVGNILINLDPNREESSVILLERYQEELKKAVQAEVSVGQYGSGPPSGAPVEIVISGPDLTELERYGVQFENILLNIPGTRDVNTSIQERSGEFVLQIDRAKAQIYGVSTAQVAGVLRNAISGVTATTIRHNGEEFDVVVKYALDASSVRDGKTNIIDINAVEAMTIATPKGDVPLSSFTKTDLSGTRPVIEHTGGDRVIKVTSYTTQDVSATEIFNEVSKLLPELNIPDDYTVKLGGEREDITQSYMDMFRAMILAIFLIGGAMVLQFNSYRQPFFILITIPLALIAVFPGLALVGKPLSFPGIIGVVALVGIVVNNAIILIDQINRLRQDGFTKDEAVVMAGTSRLEPILLTTITTILGLLPITLTNPLWGPLGYSIIFGLSFSSFTTLFVIPLLYKRFGEKEI